jgi:hypothetical protein
MKFNLDDHLEFKELLTKRFHERYQINEKSGCWEWTAGKTKSGYGRFSLKGQMIRAHRFSYHIYNNTNPGELLICHSCDNPICVNPKHLFLGTGKDNSQDREKKGRSNPRKGLNHPMCKLTENQIISIKKMLYVFLK